MVGTQVDRRPPYLSQHIYDILSNRKTYTTHSEPILPVELSFFSKNKFLFFSTEFKLIRCHVGHSIRPPPNDILPLTNEIEFHVF